jgi:hypothetical protein
MRRTTPIVLLFLSVLILQACASNPVDRWYQSASLVAGVNDTVADLHDVGQLTTEEVAHDLRPFLDTMNGSLDRAQARLPEGGDAFEAMMDTLMSARASILAYLAREAE